MDYKEYEKRQRKARIISYNRVMHGDQVPGPLTDIMALWYEKGNAYGDVGCCVIGEGMFFRYEGQDYWMIPFTGWQGECSWSAYVDLIKQKLADIGATDIVWECGWMD